MSLRQSLVLVCLGFCAGATLANAALEETSVVEKWSCGDHYWGVDVYIIKEKEGDEEKEAAEIDFNGDAWNERDDVAYAEISSDEEKKQITFKIKDEKGGHVRFELAESNLGDVTYDGYAQETQDSGEVSIGTCTKD